jgi:hypothetical protein
MLIHILTYKHLYTYPHTKKKTQGDFNFQPSWPQYQIITEGSIPKEHPHYPALPPTDTWTPTVSQPMRSALATKWGEEPTFTCYSYADRVSEWVVFDFWQDVCLWEMTGTHKHTHTHTHIRKTGIRRTFL